MKGSAITGSGGLLPPYLDGLDREAGSEAKFDNVLQAWRPQPATPSGRKPSVQESALALIQGGQIGLDSRGRVGTP
jgi:hypothetical protein